MNTYAVELKRTSYVTVYVDADSRAQAEDLAWDELARTDPDPSNAEWEVADIYEQFATDETRANGSN